MNISKKKYEKLNNDLVDAKAKAFDDVKKALDNENKIMRLSLQIKQERDSLIDDIAVLKANISRLERESHDLKKRNALLMNTVDDLDKENKHLKEYMKEETFYYQWQNCIDENEKLERENEKLKATNENLNNRVRNLNLNGQIQHDELMSCDGEVRYWKDKYTTLTDHIRLKAETNPGVSRYIDLVNYIDRLERD